MFSKRFEKKAFKAAVKDNVKTLYRKTIDEATPQQLFQAVSYAVKDVIIDDWIETQKRYDETDAKTVYYMSMEFLMGRALGNNLINMTAYKDVKEALEEMNIDLNVIEDQEPDAALGNGGLGRLAACFLDSLATLNYPAYGCGIRYRYGMFKQKIKDGYQVEVPDNWLKEGNPFEIRREEYAKEVRFGGNIRFEKSYTEELCDLLQRSGCIAVSGGLEVASPRLLKLINKGVTVAQVARVANNFTGAGIMVHAYLMYGFPTQTAQETIDSLETVRQMFELGLIQSGFWHRFAMTAHSPVGLHPAEYSCRVTEPPFGGFARNDVQFEALSGCDPELFSEGLRVSLYNYMNGTGFDLPLHKWFGGMKVPRTTLPPNYIERIVEE